MYNMVFVELLEEWRVGGEIRIERCIECALEDGQVLQILALSQELDEIGLVHRATHANPVNVDEDRTEIGRQRIAKVLNQLLVINFRLCSNVSVLRNLVVIVDDELGSD